MEIPKVNEINLVLCWVNLTPRGQDQIARATTHGNGND